jgi:hypothetical protein
MESRDGGTTWKAHMPPGEPWSVGTKGVLFLRNPATGEGNGDTWLVTAEGGGWWRTTNAGADWAKVSDAASPHGSNDFYYAKNGVLYAGSTPALQRSTDNGVTWNAIPNMPNSMYSSVHGDGDRMFTVTYTSSTGFLSSLESDGLAWTDYSTADEPGVTPIKMLFEPVHRILYSANGDADFWAMKAP